MAHIMSYSMTKWHYDAIQSTHLVPMQGTFSLDVLLGHKLLLLYEPPPEETDLRRFLRF